MAAHRCAHPTDEDGAGWRGEVDHDGAPVWECPICGRWWGFAWAGHGARTEGVTWLRMRSLFTGHRPSEFAALIEAHRRPPR